MDFLLGKRNGRVVVVFSDIKDIEEDTKTTRSGRRISTLSFTEDGVEFLYVLTPSGVYRDSYENGPDFEDYEITQDQQKAKLSTSWDNADDDVDGWLDRFAKANANHTRNSSSSDYDYGCGSSRSSYGSACGGSSYSYGGCGGSSGGGHYGC